MGENKSENEYMRMGIAVWMSICFFVCLYFWKTFSKGRQQFQNNLHVIEDGLRKMQEEMEKKQREKSIGCIDDIEDIETFMEKFRSATDSDSEEVNDFFYITKHSFVFVYDFKSNSSRCF